MPDTAMYSYRCNDAHDSCGITFHGLQSDVLEHAAMHHARAHAHPIVSTEMVDQILDRMAPTTR